MEKKNEEHMVCPICGGYLCWESDANASEVSDLYADDDEAVVSFYTCLNCGRSFDVYDPTKEDKLKNYKEYWGE